MIDYETFVKIKPFKDQHGLKCSQIARELNLDYRTVEKWLAKKQYQQRNSPRRASKLDPFKGEIVRMLETHPYTAAQIFQRIKEDGFDGGYTIVKEYVRKVRPPKIKAFLKLSFAPGECAQVDWGSFGSVRVGETSRRLSFFVMVLCYSRMMYVEFTVSQTMEHFLACHQNAFDCFGAVPRKIMVDNLKSAVLKRIVGKIPSSIPNIWILPITTALPLCPAPLERAMKRAVWKAVSAMSKRTFWPVLISRILMLSIRRPCIGSIRWPMSAFTAKPAKSRWTCSAKNGNL